MRATAMPSSASRLPCASSCASERCMTASAASARPISLPRPDGVITRVASCGLSPKAMMLDVSRRTGHSTMRHSAAQSTQVTTAAMVSEIARKLPDTRRNE